MPSLSFVSVVEQMTTVDIYELEHTADNSFFASFVPTNLY